MFLNRAVMVYTLNPCAQEAQAGELEASQVYRGKFQDNQGYTKKSSLKKPKPSKHSFKPTLNL